MDTPTPTEAGMDLNEASRKLQDVSRNLGKMIQLADEVHNILNTIWGGMREMQGLGPAPIDQTDTQMEDLVNWHVKQQEFMEAIALAAIQASAGAGAISGAGHITKADLTMLQGTVGTDRAVALLDDAIVLSDSLADIAVVLPIQGEVLALRLGEVRNIVDEFIGMIGG